MNDDEINSLRILYKNNLSAQRFFEWAASRQRDSADTDIDRISSVAKIARHEALALSRELQEIGIGKVIYGRRGAKTRIRWNYSLKSIGQSANISANSLKRIDPDELESLPADETNESENNRSDLEAIKNSPNENFISHPMWLRPGVRIEIKLPSDLTEREADRLSNWIKSIPFKTE